MICDYDKVRIKTTGIIGKVIDIYVTKGETVYIVESTEKGVSGGYGSKSSWKLFDCTEDELEKLD